MRQAPGCFPPRTVRYIKKYQRGSCAAANSQNLLQRRIAHRLGMAVPMVESAGGIRCETEALNATISIGNTQGFGRDPSPSLPLPSQKDPAAGWSPEPPKTTGGVGSPQAPQPASVLQHCLPPNWLLLLPAHGSTGEMLKYQQGGIHGSNGMQTETPQHYLQNEKRSLLSFRWSVCIQDSSRENTEIHSSNKQTPGYW